MAKTKKTEVKQQEIDETVNTCYEALDEFDNKVFDANVIPGQTAIKEVYPTEINEYLAKWANVSSIELGVPPEIVGQVATDYSKPHTASDVIGELKEFIAKYNAIAAGNNYRTEYINFENFKAAIIKKLHSFEV